MNAIYTTLAIGAGILCGIVSGYLVGRYQAQLIDKIRTLQESREEPPEEPVVTMGAYEPKVFLPQSDDRPVGVIESKTPERVAFETEQAIEREARGIK